MTPAYDSITKILEQNQTLAEWKQDIQEMQDHVTEQILIKRVCAMGLTYNRIENDYEDDGYWEDFYD